MFNQQITNKSLFDLQRFRGQKSKSRNFVSVCYPHVPLFALSSLSLEPGKPWSFSSGLSIKVAKVYPGGTASVEGMVGRRIPEEIPMGSSNNDIR